jgi:hypothetical protein
MAYTWKTFAQAKTDLAARLGDTGKVFWIEAELGRYIKEALRTFNSISQIYKSRSIFNTQADFHYYDLTQDANPSALVAGVTTALVPFTLTDRELITDIEYHLIEPITTDWTLQTPALTEQYALTDFTRALERRRNQFLLLTGIIVSRIQTNHPAPPSNGRTTLLDTVISVRRAAWLDADGDYTPLWRDDEFNASMLHIGWGSNAGIPQTYSVYLTPFTTIQVIPVPVDVGVVDNLVVINPANLNEVTEVDLNIPDDWAWVVKWGAMADLLSKEGQAYDPVRAKYCQQRWEEGVRFATMCIMIQQISINDVNLQPSSLADFDDLQPNWQNVASGEPTDIAICGWNLIALYPAPVDDQYSITVDLIANMPVPSADGDFIQIGREYYDAILDYAIHLASFKRQGTEFEGTYQLLNNFMKLALRYNDVLKAEAANYDIMMALSSKEEMDRPRVYEGQYAEEEK